MQARLLHQQCCLARQQQLRHHGQITQQKSARQEHTIQVLAQNVQHVRPAVIARGYPQSKRQAKQDVKNAST